MAYVSLEEAKRHLYVEHNEDDEYIFSLIETAEENLSDLINRPLWDVEKSGEKLPAPLKHCVLLLIGNLYANREGTRVGKVQQVPYTLANLYMPFRKEK